MTNKFHLELDIEDSLGSADKEDVLQDVIEALEARDYKVTNEKIKPLEE